MLTEVISGREQIGLQVIFTFIAFLSLFEGGDAEGYPCVPVDVGMEPGSKTGREEGAEFRSNFIHPLPDPCWAGMPLSHQTLGRGCFKTHCCYVVTF